MMIVSAFPIAGTAAVQQAPDTTTIDTILAGLAAGLNIT